MAVTDTAMAADSPEAPADTAAPADPGAPPAEDVETPSDPGEPKDVTAQEETASPKDTEAPKDTAAPPVDAGPPPPIAATYATSIGDWKMKPGEEETMCVVKRLDNPAEMFVSAIHVKLNKGSHHLIVYKSTATTEQKEPFKCTPFAETISGDTYPIMISQIAEETLAYPSGKAMKFAANQMIRLEAHYLNYFADDISAHADITFDTIDAKNVEDEVDMLFYGNPEISLPPNTETSGDWKFLDAWKDIKIFAMTGHTHALGTNVEVNFASSSADTGTPIYPGDATFEWDAPVVTQFNPPLTVPDGGGFRYRCSWNNTTAKNVGFGESANKEMCFFWAYYYPSKGYRLCVNTGKYKDMAPGLVKEQECCPDSALCGLIKQFLMGGL